MYYIILYISVLFFSSLIYAFYFSVLFFSNWFFHLHTATLIRILEVSLNKCFTKVNMGFNSVFQAIASERSKTCKMTKSDTQLQIFLRRTCLTACSGWTFGIRTSKIFEVSNWKSSIQRTIVVIQFVSSIPFGLQFF